MYHWQRSVAYICLTGLTSAGVLLSHVILFGTIVLMKFVYKVASDGDLAPGLG